MTEDRFGRSFCLVHESGELLYPVRVKNRDTGRLAFRVSKGGTGSNTKASGREEDDESTVHRLVQHDGWAVRVSSLDRAVKGLYKIRERSIVEFRDLRPHSP